MTTAMVSPTGSNTASKLSALTAPKAPKAPKALSMLSAFRRVRRCHADCNSRGKRRPTVPSVLAPLKATEFAEFMSSVR